MRNTPLVELRHIRKIFNSGSVTESCLFEDFSLTVEQDEFVSVVGSNGSGKTTMLNLICGSLAPDSGTIYLKNRDITKLPEHRRSASIGRVFQDPSMGTCPGLTILENMALADNKGKGYGQTKQIGRAHV